MANMRILLLEEHKSTQELLLHGLTKIGHSVEVVDNGHQGFLEATAKSYDVIISDISIPHWDGFKFIEAMEVVRPQLPIIVVTPASTDPSLVQRLHGYNSIVRVLSKPVDIDTIIETLAPLHSQKNSRLNKMARIVATIGPASSSEKIIGQMILAGMDVARLNFSHGSYTEHEKALTAIRKAEELWEKPVAVLVDLCGPKIRTGAMKDGSIELKAEEMITIQADNILGTEERFSTIVPEIIGDLKKGDPILLDDGLLELRVVRPGEEEVLCEIVTSGRLYSHKGMNLPETRLSLPSVTEKDWQDLEWALAHQVDYVALSFVRSAREILDIKHYISVSDKPELRVVAKIEKPEAIRNLNDIIEASDAVMIARGDMGVELPAARVPRMQQKIIDLCWRRNTPVITATQMLDSMTTRSRPTRAEVTDVSVAIQEGTDAVMLSQETATGYDPVNVVRTMASIICEEESHAKLSMSHFQQLARETGVNPVLTAAAALNTTRATILFDFQGTLYPTLSKWNRKVTSILITGSVQIARHASLYKNIVPLLIDPQLKRSELLGRALECARLGGYVQSGDIVAVIEGEYTNERNIKQIGTLQLIKA